MKKFLALLLSIVMVVTCFAGCATKEAKSEDKKSESQGSTDVVVNKELNASKLVFAETMNVAEKLPDGAKATVNVALSVKPAAEMADDAMLQQLSPFMTEKSDGSYEISVSLIGTMDENGCKIIAKIGDKEITDCIFTSDMKIFVNVKSIFNLAKEALGFNLPIDLPADYVELTQVIEILNSLDLIKVSEKVFAIEDLLSEAITDDVISEEELLSLVSFIGGEEIANQILSALEQLEGVISTILDNPELNAFINTILVKASDAKLFAVTDNSMSLNISKDSIKGTVNGVCDVILSDACNVAESLVNGLSATEMLDEGIKSELAKFDKTQIQNVIETFIDVDSILKGIDEELAFLGTSYLQTGFSVSENSMESNIEVFVDGTNVDEIKDVLQTVKVSASSSMELTAVDAIKAPTSVFSAQDLEMISGFLKYLPFLK